MSEYSIARNDFLVIRDFIHKMSGIFLEYEKEYLFRHRFDPILDKLQITEFSEFASILKSNVSEDLRDHIISAVATHETSFFRDDHPFKAFNTNILPQLHLSIAKSINFSATNTVNILSLGSSTGQEPYSIAMLVKEFYDIKKIPDFEEKYYNIYAVDIDRFAMEYARKGKFSVFEIGRGLDYIRRDKYFEFIDGGWQINDELRKSVKFIKASVNEPDFWVPFNENVNVIFARNLLIYFDTATRNNLLELFFNALVDKGILILGASENLYGMKSLFESGTIGKTIIYKKK